VHLIEDLEGLGIQRLIAGSANRFGVITEAGDAYLIPKGSLEPELMELEDESAVRMIGVGSKFEVVVTEDNIWVRGQSESCGMLCWVRAGKLISRQLLAARHGRQGGQGRICQTPLLRGRDGEAHQISSLRSLVHYNLYA
jgi:hypothetical protein